MKTLTIEITDIDYLNLKNTAKALKLSKQDTMGNHFKYSRN
jgi:hypothetical protein